MYVIGKFHEMKKNFISVHREIPPQYIWINPGKILNTCVLVIEKVEVFVVEKVEDLKYSRPRNNFAIKE